MGYCLEAALCECWVEVAVGWRGRIGLGILSLEGRHLVKQGLSPRNTVRSVCSLQLVPYRDAS